MKSLENLGNKNVRMFDDSLYGIDSRMRTLAMKPLDESKQSGYSKMFEDLPPFAPNDLTNIAHVRSIGAKGGPMDAQDPPITTGNPLDGNHKNNPDNPNVAMTVGFTFLGQFIDHDLTADPLRLSDQETSAPNGRSRYFDLDSVYGRGPVDDPELYTISSEKSRKIKFRLDPEANWDLPRNENAEAIIADRRNDENVIISQMQLAFLKFHNAVTDHLAEAMLAKGTIIDPMQLFHAAQKSVRRHYQWIVINQFLATSIDTEVFEDIKNNGPQFYKGSMTDHIPREFQVAAYRFGHSQIRPGYQINAKFGAPIFDASIKLPVEKDPDDLRGGFRDPRRFVEWDTFFDFGTMVKDPDTGNKVPKVKKNKRIDPFISSPLFDLPVGPGLVAEDDIQKSLAGRNLERHLKHGLASGQMIADKFGYVPLLPSQLEELNKYGFQGSTPLWYYILKEAFVQNKGERLGKVGSRIVAEVFFGLLKITPDNYLTESNGWTPDLPQREKGVTGQFTMTDLLSFSGVAETTLEVAP